LQCLCLSSVGEVAFVAHVPSLDGRNRLDIDLVEEDVQPQVAYVIETS
jgi:hypothetical protein